MRRAKAATAVIGMACIASHSALAAGRDYEFQPVAVEVKNGKDIEPAVRLVHNATGRPVEGAVIFRARLDVSPDNMAAMTAKHAAMPAAEPGIYRFKADLAVPGGRAFKLQAKLPGENETIEGTVVFAAK